MRVIGQVLPHDVSVTLTAGGSVRDLIIVPRTHLISWISGPSTQHNCKDDHKPSLCYSSGMFAQNHRSKPPSERETADLPAVPFVFEIAAAVSFLLWALHSFAVTNAITAVRIFAQRYLHL